MTVISVMDEGWFSVVLQSDGSYGWVVEIDKGVAVAGIAGSLDQARADAGRYIAWRKNDSADDQTTPA